MQKPKGTKDIYGRTQEVRQYVLNVLREVSSLYNFDRIDTPIFESKAVYVRSVGETSDIVSKEMYEFTDKGKREMVLRPEGTAGTIRAIVENKLYAQSLPLKLYYEGPMFRYENPQKGRQRQFTQFGVEVLGDKAPLLDAEIIMFAATILDSLNLKYVLKINSLGNKETRTKWSDALKKHFKKHLDELTELSKSRLETNPMRILDDKVDSKKEFVINAPKIKEFYDEETKEYFEKITSFLTKMQVNFEIDENLVRGLDYYTDTAFEFVSLADGAGAQSTLIGGGRYQNLVKQFGGPDLSGIGFGLGLERIVNDLLESMSEIDMTDRPDVYVLNIDEETSETALGIVYMLRAAGIKAEWNYKATKLKKAFTKSSQSGAYINVIAGSKELAEGKVAIKSNGEQSMVSLNDILDHIETLMERRNNEEN